MTEWVYDSILQVHKKKTLTSSVLTHSAEHERMVLNYAETSSDQMLREFPNSKKWNQLPKGDSNYSFTGYFQGKAEQEFFYWWTL